MVIVLRKPQKGLVDPGNPPTSVLMSDKEFADAKAKAQDAIDRETAADILGISVRTLDRWDTLSYGPKRRLDIGGGKRFRYSRSEVLAFLAAHGEGVRRPRSRALANVCME